jgi:hypothetical protein
LKLVHYRSKYLEKSSPLPDLKLAGEFCIGEPGLKINTASAKVFRPLKNQQPEKNRQQTKNFKNAIIDLIRKKHFPDIFYSYLQWCMLRKKIRKQLF